MRGVQMLVGVIVAFFGFSLLKFAELSSVPGKVGLVIMILGVLWALPHN